VVLKAKVVTVQSSIGPIWELESPARTVSYNSLYVFPYSKTCLLAMLKPLLKYKPILLRDAKKKLYYLFVSCIGR
jgi:hypothetical protein